MKEIQLNKGLFTQVDDVDFEYLNQWKWYAAYDNHNTTPCAIRRGRKSQGERNTIYMHREIMKTPDNLQVDHEDHIRLNNQRYNLRNCTHSQNAINRNSFRNSMSKYKGVTFNYSIIKGKRYEYFRVRIMLNGTNVNIGNFPTEIEAAKAYDLKAKELHGEFANLNFKSTE